ncbi:hypothetical protein [Ralstonia sp. ASV6]|uniref:hypothetical protein n=1 Tax=Ralstonia sp. ASV6 TaxID=2795124 RepID=UPI0018EDFBAF|nr:hypothetical protein [Ralstonia sp. ASV6]
MDTRLSTQGIERAHLGRSSDATVSSHSRRGADAAQAAQASAALSASAQTLPIPKSKLIGPPLLPGAAANFTASQAQLNTDVTGVQRALAFADAAAVHLHGLKASLSAALSGAPRAGDDPAARIARFDALWRERAAATGGVLDAQLAVRPAGDATRTFRLRGLDVEQWRRGSPEMLTFHPAGLGKQTASLTFGDDTLEPAAFARRLDRALASNGIRVTLAADGQVDFTVAESRWPVVRDQMMLRGAGKRFPGGRPSRARADVAPEAVEPGRWKAGDRASQRVALREVVLALEGLGQAQQTLRAELDVASKGVREGTGRAARTLANDAAQSVTAELSRTGDYNVLSAVSATLSGLSRARVETLLKA